MIRGGWEMEGGDVRSVRHCKSGAIAIGRMWIEEYG
jgi:hypothetical protein